MMSITNDTPEDGTIACFASLGDNDKPCFEMGDFASANTMPKSLGATIEDDKRYGKLSPANGKYFTYAILNEDEEYTVKQIHQAVTHAYRRWALYGNLPRLKKVGKDHKGPIDFRIEFRTVQSDPDKKLTENVIMYHYYPINNLQNPLRGLCVVNKKFFFTSDGLPRTKINSTSGTKYSTIDFDQVYAHELGHGLGFPHADSANQLMSYRYDLMSEYPTMRDQARIKAKYGHKPMRARILQRWLKWLRIASERN